MSSAAVPNEPDIGATPPAPLVCPPCLERRGPALVELSDESGAVPQLARVGFILHAGRRYRLRVRPQQRHDSRGEGAPAIVPDLLFLTLVPPTPVQTGTVTDYITTVRADLFRPVPRKARFTVTVQRGRCEPFTLTIPVLICPSLANQFSWLFSTLFLSVLLPKITTIMFQPGGSLRAALGEVWQALDFWRDTLFIAVGLILVRFAVGFWTAYGVRRH